MHLHSEILRMFNASFNDFAKQPSLDLYPERLRPVIDEVRCVRRPNALP